MKKDVGRNEENLGDAAWRDREQHLNFEKIHRLSFKKLGIEEKDIRNTSSRTCAEKK